MKKILAISLALLFLSPFFVYSNNLQKVYTTRDEIYQRVDTLCRIAGVTGPTSFSPMPSSALKLALDRIDTNTLPPKVQVEYDKLYDIIMDNEQHLYEEAWLEADLELSANLQFNVANYEDLDFSSSHGYRDRRNEQLVPYRYEFPALSLYPQLYFGNNVFLEADFFIKNNNSRVYESSFGWLLTFIPQFSFFGERNGTTFGPEIPYRAGASIGNEYFNFMFGRFPHSIGTGITGNLIIGDNFVYQEITNLSLMSNLFSYNISVTRFDQQELIDPQANPYLTKPSRQEFSGNQQFRVNHRLDLNLFDKVRLAVDLMTIYNSNYGFDARFFYPFMIAHNYYNYTNSIEKTNFDEANNMIGINLDIAITKGLSLSTQFALDQLQTYFEDQDTVPSAYAFLGNLKYSTTLSKGNLNTWIEGVYTNPYIYLNGKIGSDGIMDYNLDYVVGYHSWYATDFGYSGYVFGPDSLVFAIGGQYDSYSKWKINACIMYKTQGIKGFSYNMVSAKETYIDMSNAFFESTPDKRTKSVLSKSLCEAEHLVQFRLGGSYLFDSVNLELFGMGCINSYFNYMLEQGRTKIIPQFSFGVKWNGL